MANRNFKNLIHLKIKNRKNILKQCINQTIKTINNKFNFNYKQLNSNFYLTAINNVLTFFNIVPNDVPQHLKKNSQKVKFLINTHGLMFTIVDLEKNWFKNTANVLIAFNKQINAPVAIIPSKTNQCFYIDPISGEKIKITEKNESHFETSVLNFYEPLPYKPLNLVDIFKFLKKSVTPIDLIKLILISASLTFIGLSTPKMINLIFNKIIKLNNLNLLILVAIFLITTTLAEFCLNFVKNFINNKIVLKLILKLETALTMRIFKMPSSFFKDNSPGEIYSKLDQFKNFLNNLFPQIINTFLLCLFSITYFFQIYIYSPQLMMAVLIFMIIGLSFIIFAVIQRSKLGLNLLNLNLQKNKASLELISNIEKIKITGCEQEAFLNWSNCFLSNIFREINPPLTIKLNNFILNFLNLSSLFVLYILAAIKKIEPANFFSFVLSYSILENIFLKFAITSIDFAKINSIQKFIAPILKTPIEPISNKIYVNKLTGKIVINNLSFAYNAQQPFVLNNISIEIKAGETIALVGKTGCGKTTLLRILTGLEIPSTGVVFFDNYNLNSINLNSLRNQISAVFKNDKLFNGNLFYNIAVKNKKMSIKQVWQAAKKAQIDCDIEKMPLKMNSLITQEGGELSNGQKQRILIARAFAAKSKILILDEATAAIDEQTNLKIMNEIKTLNCTKLIVAHRLSTIKTCSRIIAIDNGKIVEDGSFNELINKKKYFFNLVKSELS